MQKGVIGNMGDMNNENGKTKEQNNQNSSDNNLKKSFMIDSYHRQDKVFKESMELFKGGSLDFLGIETQGTIEAILATEITETTTKKAYADSAFRITNNNGLHSEMEDKVDKDDILRFALYNLYLSQKHDIPFETVIITAKKPAKTIYENKSISFKPTIICLADRDADKTIRQIEDKLSKGKAINLLELVYLPLYKSKEGKSRSDLLDYAIKLTPSVTENQHIKEKLGSLLILLMSRFIDEKNLIKVLEANRMNLRNSPAVRILGEMGREEGRVEGRVEGRDEKAIETALKMRNKGYLLEDIADILEKPIIWVEELFQGKESNFSKTT